MVCSPVALLPRIDYTAYHFLGALLLHQATVHSTSSDYVTVSKWVFFSFYHCIYRLISLTCLSSLVCFCLSLENVLFYS